MSIKIYNAYVCDENYSMHSIVQKMQDVRREIRQAAETKRAEYLAKEYVYYMDYLAIFGHGAAQQMYEKLESNKEEKRKLSDYAIRSLWKCLAENNDKNHIVDRIATYFENRAYEDSASRLRIDSDFDYNCSVVIIPLEDKQLLMYFGNPELQEVVRNQPWLSDYHYQNQTDHPKSISDDEWEERRVTWEKAIGPDYRPINYGLGFTLFDSAYDFIGVNIPNNLSQFTPPMEERVSRIVDCMTDYPNPPQGGYSVEWVKYMRSPEFLNWRKEKAQEVQLKLEQLPTNH